MDINYFNEFKDAIQQNIASADIDAATLKMMDCAEEFSLSNNNQSEALAIRALFSDLNREVIKYGDNDETRRSRSKLINRLINLLEDFSLEVNNRSYEIAREQEKHVFNFEDAIFKNKKTGEGDVTKSVFFLGKKITKKFKGFALRDVDLTCFEGEITAVVGENASGKTTLLNLLSGSILQDSGETNWYLTDSKNWYFIKNKIAYFRQVYGWTRGKLINTLQYIANINGYRGKDNSELINGLIYRLRLEDHMDKDWLELSEGFKARFQIACLLIRKPKLLILDEPLAHLDINSQQLLLKDLKDFVSLKKYPMSIVITSQHLYEIESIANKILLLDKGNVIYYGNKNEINKDRECNFYEIESNDNEKELLMILQLLNANIQITEWGTYYVIKTPIKILEKDILRHLINNNVSIKYFRNVSTSTRSYFYA